MANILRAINESCVTLGKFHFRNEKANFASLIWMKCKQQFFAEVAEFGVCLVGTNIIEYYIMLKQTLNKAIKV